MTESHVLELSLDTARTLAVVKQGLHRRPEVAGRQALLDIIRRIGLLQLDTISVVARSHYLVMLSRAGLYEPAELDALLYPDRALFEQWAHAACLIPVEDYAHFAPIIWARRGQPLHPSRIRRLGDADPDAVLDAVLSEIDERGPLASRDFEDPRAERGTWWDWKPAKTALEILFSRGYLMVDRREGFQRYYDLAERVLPAAGERPVRTIPEYERWATQRSVSCRGVATAAHAADYYRLRKPVTRAMLQALAREGDLLQVAVEGWQETAYVDPADRPLISQIEAGQILPEVTTFLSPFDNLTWERRRLLDLFGFAYSVEMYLPVAKRTYGYYVLPILHRGRLVGRLDPKSDRKTKTMIVRAIYLEPGEALTDDLIEGIASALHEFMAFHGSERLRLERCEPEDLRVLETRIE